MLEIVLLITEIDKQPAGSHGAGRGGVLPSTEPRCNGVQEVLTGNPSCEEPATKSTKDYGFPEASFMPLRRCW